MSANEKDRLFKELNRVQALLDEATKKRDVKRKTELELVLKSIKDQIRACYIPANQAPSPAAPLLHNPHVAKNGNLFSQPAPPVPLQQQSVPAIVNHNRPSIFSLAQSSSTSSSSFQPGSLSITNPATTSTASATSRTSPYNNRYSFPKDLYDTTVNLQRLKDQFLRLQSRTDHSIDTIIESFIIYFQHEQHRDLSTEGLFHNHDVLRLLIDTSSKFQEVEMLTPNVRESIYSIEKDMFTLEQVRVEKVQFFTDSFKRLRTLVVSSDRIFSETLDTINDLYKYFQQQQTTATSSPQGLSPVTVTDTVGYAVADNERNNNSNASINNGFSMLMNFVSEYGLRTNYTSNDCIKLLLQVCESWVQWIQQKKTLLSGCVNRCQYLLSLVRSIDFPRLIETLSMTEKDMEFLNEQLAVFIIGPSGSGKTSLVHVVAGSQFTLLRTMTTSGRTNGALNQTTSRPHYQTTINPQVGSQMEKFIVRAIGGVEPESLAMNALPITVQGRTVWIVDTPSIADTQSTGHDSPLKRDVVNQITSITNIVKAMKRCVRVKIVLCSTEYDLVHGSNTQSFQDLCDIVMGMFANVANHVSLVHVLGPVDHEDRTILSNAIQNRALSLPNSLPKMLLVDVADKLRKPESSLCGAHIVKLNDSHCRSMLLKCFLDFDSNVLGNPVAALKADCFPHSIKEDLSRQFRLSQTAIQRAITNRDVETARKLMHELFKLFKLLSMRDSFNAFVEAVRSLTTAMTSALSALTQFSHDCFVTISYLSWSSEVEDTLANRLMLLIVFDDFLKKQILYLRDMNADDSSSNHRSFVHEVKKLIVKDIDQASLKYFTPVTNSVEEVTYSMEEVKRLLNHVQHFALVINSITMGHLSSMKDAIAELKRRAGNSVDGKVQAYLSLYKTNVKAAMLVDSLSYVVQIKEVVEQLHGYVSFSSFTFVRSGQGINDFDIVTGSSALQLSSQSSSKLTAQCSEVCQSFLIHYVQTLASVWKNSSALETEVRMYHKWLSALADLIDSKNASIVKDAGLDQSNISILLTLLIEIGVAALKAKVNEATLALSDKNDPSCFVKYYDCLQSVRQIRNHRLLLIDSIVKLCEVELNETLNQVIVGLYDACKSALLDVWTGIGSSLDINQLKVDLALLMRAAIVFHRQPIDQNADAHDIATVTSVCWYFEEIVTSCMGKLEKNFQTIDQMQGSMQKEEDFQIALDFKVSADHIQTVFVACLNAANDGTSSSVVMNSDANISLVDKIKKIISSADTISKKVDETIVNQLRFVERFYESVFESLHTKIALVAFMERVESNAIRGGYTFDYGEEASRILSVLASLSHKSSSEVDRLKNLVSTKLPIHYEKIHLLLCKRYEYLVSNSGLDNTSDPTDLFLTMHITANAISDTFAELACGLKYLQSMSVVHPNVHSPLSDWIDNLQWFHNEVFERSNKWTNSSQLYQFSDMCNRMGREIDSLLPSNISFCVLARTIIGTRQDGLTVAKAAIHSKDYRSVAGSFKLLGLDTVHADSIAGLSSERVQLIESLKATLSNHFSSVISRLEKLSFDQTTTEQVISMIWKDLVQLSTAEAFLSSIVFFDTQSDLPAKRTALLDILQSLKGKAEIAAKAVLAEFRQDLVSSIMMFGKLQRLADAHNCFELPLIPDSSVVCSHCAACHVHSTAAIALQSNPTNATQGKGIQMRQINDTTKDVFAFLTTMVKRVEELLTKGITDLQRSAGSLSTVMNKNDFEKHLPSMEMLGPSNQFEDSGGLTLGLSLASDSGSSTSQGEAMLFNRVDGLVQTIEEQLVLMLDRVKSIDQVAAGTSPELKVVKEWCRVISILSQKMTMLPRYRHNNLHDKFKPEIEEYYMKVSNYIAELRVRRSLENPHDDDESDDLPAPPPLMTSTDASSSGTHHPAQPSNTNSLIALKEKAAAFISDLENDDEAVGLRAICDRLPQWVTKSLVDTFSTRLMLLVNRVIERLEAFRAIETEREKFLAAYQASKSFLDLCLKAIGVFAVIQDKHSTVYSKHMPGSMIQRLRTVLSSVTSKLHEHLSALTDNSKKLQDIVLSISHASDLQQMISYCHSFRIMYTYLSLCAYYSAELRKTIIGKDMKDLQHKPEEIVKFIQDFLTDAINFLLQMDFINRDTKNANIGDRKGFYLKVAARLTLLNELKWMQSESQQHSGRDIKISIETNIQRWISYGLESVRGLQGSGDISNVNLKNFNLASSNLQLIQEMLPAYADTAKDQVQSLNAGFLTKIREIVLEQTDPSSQNDTPRSIQLTAEALLVLHHLSSEVEVLKAQISAEINKILQFRFDGGKGAMVINSIATELNKTTDGSGLSIINNNDYKAFKAYKQHLRSSAFVNQTLDVMLNNLSGDNLDKDKIRTFAEAFDKKYWALIDHYLANRDAIPSIPQQTKQLVAGSSSKHTRDTLLDILTRICGYWTLTNLNDSGTSRTSLLKPHLGQILAILRLLGFDAPPLPPGTTLPDKNGHFDCEWFGDKTIKLRNHLTQVRTGEGKSVILGVLSTTLALLGFEVDSVCYSKHLSERDYEEFKDLFEQFNVADAIQYGTFNELCESMLNKDGNVREQVQKLISTNASASSTGQQTNRKPGFGSTGKKRILLIDEVDVFFQPGFYGSAYNVFATIKASEFPEIGTLIRAVWACKSLALPADQLLEQMKATNEYKACIRKFSNWQFVIEEGVKEMLSTLSTYESHDYHFDLEKQRIGYLDTDNTISYKKVKGYNTMFAYLKEYDINHRIKDESIVIEHMNILVHASTFSYAEFPKYYMGILGVSGTLDTLSQQEKNILQKEYRLNKLTYLPSAYPIRPMWAENDPNNIRIVKEEEFFTTIVDEITRKRGPNGRTQRPVLVFFPTKNELDVFRASDAFALYRDDALMLVAGMEENDRLRNIVKAMDSGTITLLTREFGRGTDFCCHSSDIESQGGIHVLATFVSLEVSEEKQIIGRTGRQGKSGSFSMVLKQNEIAEELHLTEQDFLRMESQSIKYTVLHQQRLLAYETSFPERLKFIAQMLLEHTSSEEFVFHLLVTKNTRHVTDFLSRKNASTFGVIHSRTVILLDATGSMSDLLEQAKQTVKEMIDRVCEVLQAKAIQSGFQIQFGAYRNYSSHPNDLLQVSTWSSSPSPLIEYITKVRSSGGMGNEAIEIALKHVNVEAQTKKITQVIIIGDAASNTRSEVESRRRGYPLIGQDPRYATAVYFEEELQALCAKNIRINAFYIKGRGNAQRDFERMAMQSGGKSAALDVKSAAAVSVLTDIVSVNILQDIGRSMGGQNAEDLVNAYKSKYAFQAEGFV